jgi:amino acid adenylation domain-containing protein
MNERGSNLPPEQQAIRDKCFHPSGTFFEFPIEDVETSISARFEKIVGMYPERIAIRTKTRQLTYGALNRQANRIAHELLAQRGAKSEPIALLVDQWDALVVGHLAILKSGKFSLALDPAGELERTTHLLRDSESQVVIVDQETISSVDELVSKNCLVINLNELMPNLSEDNPNIHVSTEAYSYVRYTSGSTGNAKGAMKSHRHVLKDVMDFVNHFHICPDDNVALLSFASIGKHLLSALLTGARFCPFDARKEGLIHLADWLRQEQITFFYSFPTAFRYFVNGLSDSEMLSDLRLIEFEGEPLYRNDVEILKKHVTSDCVVVNALSSAETGTVSLYFLDMKTQINSERVPVGYPVEGVEILILDDDRHPLDCDQVGEVAVRSSYLSDGYWGKPDVTNQKFIAQSDDGSRAMYLSGDLGRLSADGCLRLFGRKDFQVKIRSFRVDVTEVETALKEHGEIRSVAVIGKNDQIGNTRLVAYVVPQKRPEPNVATLKLFLKDKLPEYMVPTEFVFLDDLPLMSTGKINRRALPVPLDAGFKRLMPVVTPRTRVEKRLAEIWAEVLSVPELSVHDNFFDLGGHSLVASQLICRVIQKFHLELPIKALFDAPTVAKMALIITQNQAKLATDAEVARMLCEVEAMTEEEAEKLLAGEDA